MHTHHTGTLIAHPRQSAWTSTPAGPAALPQVNQLDGLQHMHIPAGQTYKSPGMAYVEGDASSGEGSGGRQQGSTRARGGRRGRARSAGWQETAGSGGAEAGQARLLACLPGRQAGGPSLSPLPPLF